ncbi:hypothetical protein THAOC_25027, partial [Thalassiosira oceanica]
TKFVEDPTSFRPERFLPEAVDARRGTPSEILDHPSFVDPFGRGKRRCLGSNVAVAEITVLAARLVQDYELSLEDPENAVWSPKQKLMLKADPYLPQYQARASHGRRTADAVGDYRDSRTLTEQIDRFDGAVLNPDRANFVHTAILPTRRHNFTILHNRCSY